MAKIAIIGAGNIGTAIANGLAASETYSPKEIYLTRRKVQLLEDFAERGFSVTSDNQAAVERAEIVVLCVEPQHLNGVLDEISSVLDPDLHTVISVVTGATIRQIADRLGKRLAFVRAMPNTAIAVRESMTCLATNGNGDTLRIAQGIFDTVGRTHVINEESMIAATALGACGIAFFLRAIRAASQGGIEVGFHADDALSIAAQTAKGAASLLSSIRRHPEFEIDKVTTPRGCTIAGLNRMEHEGFSSAMIRGITVSAAKASGLYTPDEE
jgi:pyrroline-5-carboxylate reductase